MNDMIKRINNFDNATYGLEIEAAGMRRDTVLDPETEGTWCLEEGSIRELHTGIGNDPKGVYNLLGGEIQVRYAHSEEELLNRALHLLDKTKCPTLNMPSTGHTHIRVPELMMDENLDILKKIVLYNQKWLPQIIDHISPLPSMEFMESQTYHSEEQRKMFIRAYKDKHRTRHSIFTESQIERMMSENDSFLEFIHNIANARYKKTGGPMWITTPRTGVNFSKMRPNNGGTLEFRMFSMTSDPVVLKNTIEFPRKYLECAILDIAPDFVYDLEWPSYYNWTMEDDNISKIWIKTDHDKVDRKEVIENIKLMLQSGEISLDDLGNPPFWNDKL